MNKKKITGITIGSLFIIGIFSYSAYHSTRQQWENRYVSIQQKALENPNNPDHNQKNYLQIQGLESSKL